MPRIVSRRTPRRLTDTVPVLMGELTKLGSVGPTTNIVASLLLDECIAEMEDLQDKLNAIGNEAQLANVDLQNILQNQQQTLQMLSDISKMLYDTAMAVIRHIGS